MAAILTVVNMGKRQSDVKRVERLILLLALLRDRRWTVSELAARCEVSRRTIKRDLVDIGGAVIGAPVQEDGERYWIQREWTCGIVSRIGRG